MAYASLAGLPSVHGLYAAVLPLLVYALLGTSPVLSVGPVSILSLLTAEAVQSLHVHHIQTQSEVRPLSCTTMQWRATLGVTTH